MPIVIVFPTGREIHLQGENLDELGLNQRRRTFIEGLTRETERPVRINKESILMAQVVSESKLLEIEAKQREAMAEAKQEPKLTIPHRR